jgi:hypothetical protein
LKQLLSDNFAAWQDAVIEPVDPLSAVPRMFSRTESWRVGMAQRPELAQARFELERRGVIVKYRRNQRWPQLDAVGSFG